MILDRIQHYLSIAFFTVLIITQALVFVSVSASNEGDFLQVVFIEPLSENIDIGDSVYFQAMIADQEDKNYDLVYFNLKNLNTGLDENYQASLQDDGTWIAQNIWDTNNYSVDQYYISVVAHSYNNNSAEDIYYSQNQLINLNGSYEMAETVFGIPLDNVYFNYPINTTFFNAGINNNFTTILYVDNYLSNTVSEIEFTLLSVNASDNMLLPFEEASNMGVLSNNPNYTSWTADVDVSELLDGEYKVAAVVKFIDSASEEYILESDIFVIITDETSFQPEEGNLAVTTEIIEPNSNQMFFMGDIMDVLVSISTDTGYVNLKITHKSEDFSITKGMSLEDNLNNVYGTSIDFNNDGPNGAPFILGNYLIQFELGYRESDFGDLFPTEEVSFSLQENEEEELVYEIIDRNSLDGTLIEGYGLELDFETSFEAENFTFDLFKEENGASVIGISEVEIVKTDGYLWNVSVLAQDHGFTNGTYILKARANVYDSEEEMLVEFGPSEVNWQITEEDEVIIPTLAIHLEDTNLNPGVILIGSGNILGAEFILQSTINEELFYSFESNLVDCSNSHMISSDIQELTLNLEHSNCFYYILGEEDLIANSNYYAYLQRQTAEEEYVLSSKLVVTYFDENNQDLGLPDIPEDIILRIYKPDLEYNNTALIVSSNWDAPETLQVGPFIIWENKDTGELFYTGLQIYTSQSSQEIVPLVPFIDSVVMIDEPIIPYIWIAPAIDTTRFPDGEYFVYAGYNARVLDGIQSENSLSITINTQGEIEEESIIFELHNIESNLNKDSILYASSNIDDVDFVFQNTENFIIHGEYISCENENIPDSVRQEITNGNIRYCFMNNLEGEFLVDDTYNFFLTKHNVLGLKGANYVVVYSHDRDQENDNEKIDREGDTVEENLVIDYYSTCIEQGIEDEESCMQFRAIMDLLNQTCIEQGIYEAIACEDYLYRMETDLECQENNIIDREECKNYLLEEYGSQVDCQLDDTNLCNNILRNEYLNRLVVEQRLGQNINQVVNDLLGQNISTQELSDALELGGVISLDVLPLLPKQDTKVLLTKAQKETVLEEKDKLTILNQAVIILDTDGDGLSDDLEPYYGTEINNSDTDGDGYSDGEEIKNGYDPLGPGPLIKERTNFDLVTLDDEKIIEQPKVKSKKIDKKMEVQNINTFEEKLSLAGKAAPNTWVNLYLYSGLPLVMTTKTDASGNWSYDIKDSLTDGHHRVFVTVNDDTGKIVKQSRPISFLIKGAKAVTSNDYLDETSSSTAVNNLFIYYVLGGAFLVFLALGAIVYMYKGKNKNLEV